jgi:hypothetical protein
LVPSSEPAAAVRDGEEEAGERGLLPGSRDSWRLLPILLAERDWERAKKNWGNVIWGRED